MNLQVTNPEAAQQIRELLFRLCAYEWHRRYNEPFASQWEVTSVNVVGDMLDVTFTWVE